MQFPNNNRDKNEKKPDPDKQLPPAPPPQPDWRRWIWPVIALLLLGWVVIQFTTFGGAGGSSSEIPFNTMSEQALDGNVAEITIREQDAEGEFRSPVPNPLDNNRQVTQFSVKMPPSSESIDHLVTALNENGAVVTFETNQTSTLLVIILNWLPFVLLIGFFVWTARRAQRQMTGAFGFGRTQAREYTIEKPKVTFEDVAGQDAAKAELVEIVDFLREPDKYIALGARIPRGVLLVGPPGTGKTLLARAVAGEASVSFFSITASEFVEMFVGVGASRVRDLFKRAKDNAPSIVFIDEIDAVGRHRGTGLGGGNDEREQTLNQMLSEMDGFDQTESVIVMAATNRPDVLDPALLRPGRFDRQITVALPDRVGRLAVLKIHTRGKPLDKDVNLDQLARGTIGFSGADLANLANEAALNGARRNRKKITMRDFSDAFDRIILGSESPPLSNEQERRLVAYHEAGHALISALVPDADPVLKVTIVPRGQALGVTATMPNDDRRNYSRRLLRVRMIALLGGRAAEEVKFGEVTTGAENDLMRVTDLARRMVAQFGMSESFGPLNFGDHDRQPFLGYSLAQGRTYSEETAAKIDAEVRRIVEEAYEETVNLLRKNKDKLDALAEALMTHEVVEQDQILQVIGMKIEDVLPPGVESVEELEEKKRSRHFSLKLPKEMTDEGIIGDDVNGQSSEPQTELDTPTNGEQSEENASNPSERKS